MHDARCMIGFQREARLCIVHRASCVDELLIENKFGRLKIK